MDQTLIEQVNLWTEADEHARVIETLEKIPAQEREFDTIGLLARAYINIDQYEKALSLLDSTREQGEEDTNWNFRKGYALYYLERYKEALACFKKADELTPDDEDTIDFIRQCNAKIPFSKRVADFWQWFTENEEELSRMVENRNDYSSDDFIGLVARGTNLISENVNYNLGGDYEFTFSVEGNTELFYIYPYLIEQMPAQFKDKWHFFPFNQGTDQSFSFEMYGAKIEMANVAVEPAYNEENNTFSIRFYEPNLCTLPDNQCYNAYYIMMEIVLGEGMSYQYIGNVERADAPIIGMMPLTSLRGYIVETLKEQGKEIFDNPKEVYSGYRLEPQENEELRFDILTGTTCFTPLLSNYYNDSTDLFDRLNSFGVQAAYIAFPYHNEQDGDMNAAFKFRCELEDALDAELLKPEGLGLLLGGATGECNCYIDLLLFDEPAFVEKITTFLKRFPDYHFYISDFRQHCDIYRLFDVEEDEE